MKFPSSAHLQNQPSMRNCWSNRILKHILGKRENFKHLFLHIIFRQNLKIMPEALSGVVSLKVLPTAPELILLRDFHQFPNLLEMNGWNLFPIRTLKCHDMEIRYLRKDEKTRYGNAPLNNQIYMHWSSCPVPVTMPLTNNTKTYIFVL